MKKIIIISITSNIGQKLAEFYNNKKLKILGSFRKKSLVKKYESNKNILLHKLDLSKEISISKFCKNVNRKFADWDCIIFCNGDLKPINKFCDVNFDLWEKSLKINCISSLRILNKILKIKKRKKRNIIFFAGGGTNNATKYYSSYTLSKIFLMKFVELLDFEEKYINTCILGPGWINTKIHSSTIQSKIKNFENKKKTIRVLKRDDTNKLSKLVKCIDWIINNMKVITGRNLSLDYDNWGSRTLIKKLKKNKNIYKLRRYGN